MTPQTRRSCTCAALWKAAAGVLSLRFPPVCVPALTQCHGHERLHPRHHLHAASLPGQPGLPPVRAASIAIPSLPYSLCVCIRRSLAMSNNKITGAIPSTLNNLKNLQYVARGMSPVACILAKREL